MQKTTVQDVAMRAGVSASTVSRVLNKNHDISADTVASVEQAIKQLGYQRGATKRGRRPTRVRHTPPLTSSLALLIPDTHIEAMLTPLTGQLMHGIESVARSSGFNLLLTRLAENGDLPPCLTPLQVQGLIVRSGETLTLERLLPQVPTVWIFRPTSLPTHGDLVHPDNEAIGEVAARFLQQRGAKRMIVIDPQPTHPEARQRTESFLRHVENSGTPLHWPGTDMMAFAKKLSGKKQQPTGVFLPLGDDYVENFYRALQTAGFAPETIELISCNNDTARLHALAPHLPNIEIRAEEIGRVAAETLLWRLKNLHEPRRRTLIEPRLAITE